jgi:hypothetical protein
LMEVTRFIPVAAIFPDSMSGCLARLLSNIFTPLKVLVRSKFVYLIQDMRCIIFW